MTTKGAIRRRLTAQLRRAVLLSALVLVLPCIALAERVRSGAGRAIARRTIPELGRLLGIRFQVCVDPSAARTAPAILVANHASPLDIAAVLLVRPTASFLMADELFRIPLLGSAARALGCVPVQRHGSARQAHDQLATLADAPLRDLVVFAEGGIRRGGLGRFRSGAFRLAITTGTPVIPVSIGGTAAALGDRLVPRRGVVTVDVAAPISTDVLGPGDHRALRGHTRGIIEQTLRRRTGRNG